MENKQPDRKPEIVFEDTGDVPALKADSSTIVFEDTGEMPSLKNDGAVASVAAQPVVPAAATKPKREINISILFKQVGITVGLILATVFPISHQSVKMFSENSISRARDANRDQAHTRALALENQLENILGNVRMLGAMTVQNANQAADVPNDQEKIKDLIFSKDGAVVSLEILNQSVNIDTGALTIAPTNQLTNKDFLEHSLLSPDYMDMVKAQVKFPIQAIFSSTAEKPVIEVRNSSIENGIPLLAIGIPLMITDTGQTTHIAVAYLRLDALQKLITTNERMIFAVDQSGTVLAHPDDKLTLSREKLNKSTIVQKALSSELNLGDLRFQDESKENYIGAYAKTKFGITVISQVSESILLEDALNIRHAAFGIAAMVISIALFFIAVFAMTLTAPIEKLELFARAISKGDFKSRVNIKSRDEVGRLSKTMNEMVEGLIERDKAKSVITKFHGSLGEELMKGTLERKGTRKRVTVFFSDIRGFTKFGEKHTAEEVVEMLNEYFGVMVKIINKNNGVVDKFIGDAIMAVWGVMANNEPNVRGAVTAALEMREGLVKFNEERRLKGHDDLMIGIGLHCGDAIAGTIGSDERLEYTVIGDTVNLASRIEASTKAFGTDLLISETVVEDIQDSFWLEEAGKAEVKGKSQPITMYKVRGRIVNGEKVEVRTPFSDYESGDAEKIKLVS